MNFCGGDGPASLFGRCRIKPWLGQIIGPLPSLKQANQTLKMYFSKVRHLETHV
jgi:hypothetical protein